jgi:putative redox protein
MELTARAQSVPGTLRQQVTVADRFYLVTDEPESLGGEDTAPSPHELLPAAVASCISVTMAMYARAKGWDLGEVTVDVSYDPKARPRRFDVDITIAGELDAEQLARLEKVAATCPVRRALEGDVEFDERILLNRTAQLIAP